MTEIKIPIPTRPDISWNLYHMAEVDSTNRVVSDLAKQDVPEGRAVLADYQAAGRGRLDRHWIASPGSSVLMSVLLRPTFSAQFFYLITSALSLAVLKVLESKFAIPCKLKWPNDVMVSDKKIAGVLAAVGFGDNCGAWVVAGLGLNCSQSRQELDESGIEASSIYSERGIMPGPGEITEIAKEILAEFGGLYLSLDDQRGRTLVADLYRKSCSTLGEAVKVEMVGETFIGIASDISVEGHLIVQAESNVREVPAGDVVHLRKRS